MKNQALKKAIEQVGNQSILAKKLGITPQAVQSWTVYNIPPKWVSIVSKETGIPKEELRPDIFG